MEVLYEMWLHCACGFEPDIAAKAAPLFENTEEGFASDTVDAALLKELGISDVVADKIRDPEAFIRAREIIEYCDKNDIRILTRESGEYPDCLKQIDLPPRILFAKGLPLDECIGLGVAIVGTRKPTDYGKTSAKAIGKSLAESGITVVGGMAEGIDTEGHRGALAGGGKTVAVLAGSVDNIYPRSNDKLYYEILKRGTVVSERPPGCSVRGYFYTQRNRIIVGLSRGVVVVEGELTGGTAITADWCVRCNRDMFAVPGSPAYRQSSLPNSLIADGATIVGSFDVPSVYYGEQLPELVKPKAENAESVKTPTGLSEDEKTIYRYLDECGGIASNEQIMEGCGLPQKKLNVHLTMLCIKGIIRQESGNRYILNR